MLKRILVSFSTCLLLAALLLTLCPAAVVADESTYYSVTAAEVPDPIWTVSIDKTMATAGETVTVTVGDTAFTSWSTGLIVSGNSSGTTYDYATVTAATGDTNGVNGSGVYSFTMPNEDVTVSFTADYTTLDVYLQMGSGDETLVHSYTRAEMEELAVINTSPVYYAMWDRLPATFMGKAVRYVTLQQIVDSAHGYNPDVRYDGSDCYLNGEGLDGWTLGTSNLSWTYLMGTPRYYYAALGDQYLDTANQTGLDREVPAVLAITGWAGRQTYVDNQPYDTWNTYRFFSGISAEQYGDGSVPTTAERDARCTANNQVKMVHKLVFIIPQSYSITSDSSLSGGSLSFSQSSAIAGETITVTVNPDLGQQLVSGSLKYSIDSGSTWTDIVSDEGTYSFVMPEADVVVSAGFTDSGIVYYTASFISDNTTFTTISAEAGLSIEAPDDPVRGWYVFNGWYAEAELNTAVEFPYTLVDNVTFYAGWADNTEEYFTLAVLPDTQFYAESYPEIFNCQTQWIADNAQSQNIVFAAHLGDVQDDYSDAAQWQNAVTAMNIIRNAGIPYSIVPGNHDLNFDAGDSTNFDSYFPYTDFSAYEWYGGHYPETSNCSSYQLFSVMDQDFIILNLVSDPTRLAAATEWANTVLTQYCNRRAIIVAHGYIKPDGSLASGDTVSGTAIHDNIVVGHSNVIAVLCGHTAGACYTIETGSNGNTVYNLLTDYTDQDNGGNGWLRLYQFYPSRNTLSAVTYSPYLDQFDTTAGGQFDLPLDMPDKGDVNNDASIDILDVVLTVNCIMGQMSPNIAQSGAADCNRDNSVDILDLVLIVNKILGK